MSLAQKLIIYALMVALMPLAATGFNLIRISENALIQRIEEHQQAAVSAVSAKIEQAVGEVMRRVGTVVEIMPDPQSMSEPERQGLLRMIYQQSKDISIAVLTEIDGVYLAPPEFLTKQDRLLNHSIAHPLINPEDLQLFNKNLPLNNKTNLQPGAVLMSAAYFPAQNRPARVAVLVPASLDENQKVKTVAGVEIVLRNEVLRIEGIDTGEGSIIYVVDNQGQVILHPSLAVGHNFREREVVKAFTSTKALGSKHFITSNGPIVAAFAPVGNIGWGVIVEQPENIAYSAAASMRRQILIWLSATAILVLASGLLFSKRLTELLKKLILGARSFGKGNLEHRIQVATEDEIGELGQTMNSMAEQLQKSYDELEKWNKTLEIKVEERTQELQNTQTQLMQQSKLAAIGQLGAGVAHEVNNPLTGILGYVEMILAKASEDDPNYSRLKHIQTAAKRCQEITSNLLRFSQKAFAGRTKFCPSKAIGEAIEIVQGGFEAAEIDLEIKLQEDLPQITADQGQIALVLINLLNNAKNVLEKGGKVIVSTEIDGKGILITVVDNGPGIKPEHLPRIFEPFFTTKKIWTSAGLGLSVAYRIVTDHGGTINATSEIDQGTTFKVWLPLVPTEASETEFKVDRKSTIVLK